MITAEKPDNENERLKALYAYNILDTEAEKVFDDLTELASEICDTPIALISLVDPERQWFKSRVGIDAAETSRDIAFCAHAIHQQDIFEVEDTFKDIRFSDNPLVRSAPNIRFYAGTPLLNPDGFAIGTLCAISDKPKSLDAHQRKALEILGREVISQLELRLKIKQVEQANQRKSDFLSSLSHELRTPLNAVISFSQLLLSDTQLSLPEYANTYLKHIDFSGKRLLDLVNSVLDLSKIEAGKLTLAEAPTNLTQFAQSIEGIARALGASKQINVVFSFSPSDSLYLCVDEARLSQVMLNLISNAIKFSAVGSTVQIHLIVNQDSMTFAVQDHGIGIAQDELPKLFTKFYQIGRATEFEGSGLGLMISKNLVELMNGEIKLSSQLGKGTLVKFQIPVQPCEAPETAAKPQVAQFNRQANILVVEDNPINQEVAKAIFASLELDIILADSGEDALDMVKQQQFDLIFMDLHLPGIDGFETSEKITENFPSQPIVALTADVLSSEDKRIVESGMSGVLTKPILIEQLTLVLNQHCAK